ncbi:MAG: hypothetical protein NC206_10025 [Bacteroides sp.]|nr:hypothetical protein [Roseburia sp.]MCM1347404.1 hypothetical protein [Bacteroides sp.]MCM1421883.1 hypothetical protein [Bacteroides sp.]
MKRKNLIRKRCWWPFMALRAVVLFSFCTDDDSAKAMNIQTEENQVNVNGKVLMAYFPVPIMFWRERGRCFRGDQ